MRIRTVVPPFTVLAVAAIALLALPSPVRAQTPSPGNPLDPLSADEIATATEVLKASGRVEESARFHLIDLREPPKLEVLAWKPGDPLHRGAFVVVRQSSRTFEAIVDLSSKQLTTWREVENAQPNLIEAEIVGGGEIVKAHPDWQAAMRRRGIRSFDSILCAAIPPGYFGLAEESGRRLGKVVQPQPAHPPIVTPPVLSFPRGSKTWKRPGLGGDHEAEPNASPGIRSPNPHRAAGAVRLRRER